LNILFQRETKQPVAKRIHTIADKDIVVIKSLPEDFMSPEKLEDLKPNAEAAQNGKPLPAGFTIRYSIFPRDKNDPNEVEERPIVCFEMMGMNFSSPDTIGAEVDDPICKLLNNPEGTEDISDRESF